MFLSRGCLSAFTGLTVRRASSFTAFLVFSLSAAAAAADTTWPPTGFASNVYWTGPGGDIWNTNSSPYSVDSTQPFALAWSSYSHDGDYSRPSGVVLADVGAGSTPYLFGSAGWSDNRAYRASRLDGSYTPWTAANGQNDSGTGFRVALSLDGSQIYHIDVAPTIRAYATGTDPAGAALWSVSGTAFNPGLTGSIKVGPDGRIYGYRNGLAALDPTTGSRVWWSATSTDPVPMPGAFWNTGSTYHLVLAGTTTRVSAYNVQSSPGSAAVWTFTDTEAGYSGPTIDPVTGAIYTFRTTNILKLSAAGALVWRSATVPGGRFCRTYGALSRDGSTIYYHTGTNINNGRLYAFRTSDGTIKWSYATSGYARDEIGGPVVTANGLLIVGNAAQSPGDNRVYCIEDSAGVAPVLRGLFDLRNEGDIGAPWLAIGPDGGIYFDSWGEPNENALFGFRPPTYTAPAPANLSVTPFVTTARLRWDAAIGGDVAGYLFYRRNPGGGYPQVPTRYVGPRADFTDYRLQAGQTYSFRVAACNSLGAQVSPFSETTVTLLPATAHVSAHSNRDLLIAFYTGGYTPAEVAALTAGLNLGIEFYWRTTCGRLNMEPTWLYIDAPLPGSDWGSQAVIDDLRSRGMRNDAYDLAYLVGQGLSGCFGGYVVFGSTCASLGTACGAPYPGSDASVDYTIAWTFVHEIHHALESMRNVAGGIPPEVLTCHFPWCYPAPLGGTGRHVDMGIHFDGIAGLNRDYVDGWSVFPAPFDGVIECTDQDGDGFPDQDDRVPIDEAGFNSSPSAADTDGDGLDDLAEFCRYNFRGSNPRAGDSDGDGLLDGIDLEPLYAARLNLMPFAAAPTLDGTIEGSWPSFASGYYFTKNGAPFDLETYVGWRSDGLYLAFSTDRQLRFKLSVDGSGQDGRWASPVRHSEGATDTDNLDQKHTHIGDTWGDDRHIAFAYGEPTARVFGVGTIPGAQVVSTLQSGRYLTEAFIPTTLPGGASYTWYPQGNGTPVVNGLTLTSGRVIGLALTVSNLEDSDDTEFSGTWTSLFETLAFVDVTLQSVSDAGYEPAPVARVPGLYFANPYHAGLPITFLGPGSTTVESTVRDVFSLVEIYDIFGRRVRVLSGGIADGEALQFAWDGQNDHGQKLAAGVFFVRASVRDQGWRRKLVLLR